MTIDLSSRERRSNLTARNLSCTEVSSIRFSGHVHAKAFQLCVRAVKVHAVDKHAPLRVDLLIGGGGPVLFVLRKVASAPVVNCSSHEPSRPVPCVDLQFSKGLGVGLRSASDSISSMVSDLSSAHALSALMFAMLSAFRIADLGAASVACSSQRASCAALYAAAFSRSAVFRLSVVRSEIAAHGCSRTRMRREAQQRDSGAAKQEQVRQHVR